ncbi:MULTISPECIES: GMC family oxidoreductase N-terminal domain-containing protein [unclassified Crossiella]|uniref:GMC family oxidoreductase N-terminal domain-containing protein n=1 Tax=unclassified Crossiella TaxID=2620835 RepID=UPI001FFF7A18|nr:MULTISPECIES: GMC family oxidoreductase N-terminal domain-containing protein [unclassified Crossiella]MCK2241301.1 GMC family oxidoreductase N-terminal domain-containing protein [Crossiella sp. S99.2]MCK2253555.1 GMC family oxidoreductase N-terminal domain-containing protein [Crossiella sp. S99.1]
MRDVIVIGAGGGGPVVAAELAGRGLDVLLLEAGPRHAKPREEWTHFENDANNPLTGYLRFGPQARDKPAWFRETPQNSFLWQLSGVGGTTQHYYGNCPRAYPGVFAGYDGADAANYDVEHRFPFGYKDLVPYYEWVEATLPVQTAAMGLKEETFFRGCETMNIPVQKTKTTLGASYRPQENAILQPGGTAGRTTDASKLTFPMATGCTFCGYCFQGCMQPARAPRNQFAKRSTDNSYVPLAITAPAVRPSAKAATLIADAFVTKVRTERRGSALTATGVTWRTGKGQEHREDAKVVVLAAGCTETPRLWLNSGLPNPNGWVGRGYTDHHFDWVIGQFDRDTDSTKGVGSSARCEFPGYGGLENVGLPPALQAFSMTLSDSGIRGRYGNGRGATGPWDGPAGRLIGPELKEVLAGGVNRLLNVLVITDDDVEAQNRVVPSVLPADEHGPIAKVEFRQRQRTARTQRNREYLAKRATQLLRGAGAKRVFRIDWAPLILHVQSTMRMGLSEQNSVTTPTGESRAVRGLYIADNSALANALGGPNPTLTTQAVATRTAEHIFQTHFGGSPWVRAEAPIVSTDHRISQALGRLGL